ncbi:hypothetical protein GC176_28085 [bacterium]|nr:hypothetical protein [bacterium]
MTSPVSPGSSQPQSCEDIKRLYQQSIGGTFFRQMMKALRSSTGKAAYFNGGQAEKIFQGQLDELMVEKLSDVSGGTFSDQLFQHQFPDLAKPDSSAPALDIARGIPVVQPAPPAALPESDSQLDTSV